MRAGGEVHVADGSPVRPSGGVLGVGRLGGPGPVRVRGAADHHLYATRIGARASIASASGSRIGSRAEEQQQQESQQQEDEEGEDEVLQLDEDVERRPAVEDNKVVKKSGDPRKPTEDDTH